MQCSPRYILKIIKKKSDAERAVCVIYAKKGTGIKYKFIVSYLYRRNSRHTRGNIVIWVGRRGDWVTEGAGE